jgi:hypothetical protein
MREDPALRIKVPIDRRMHPALRQRVLTTSPNPAMQLVACWDALAEQAERLEGMLRILAADKNDGEPDHSSPSSEPASRQIALLAASGLQLVRSLILNHTRDDAEAEHLSKTVPRLLSNISLLLSALSARSNPSGHQSP